MIVKNVTVDKIKRDPDVKKYPCFITVQGHHNHSSRSADALQQLRVLPSIQASLVDLFEQGWLCSMMQKGFSLAPSVK